MSKIYIANGLFSEADRDFNEKLATKIDELEKFDLYVPQRNTAINDKTKCADSVAIYKGDTDELLESDILIAVLDGPSLDAGVASEIGLVAGLNEMTDKVNANLEEEILSKKFILGLYTDTREGSKTHLAAKNELLANSIAECQYPYINLYTIGAVKKYGKIVSTVDEVIDFLREWK